jgi:excisionase family DNA binding protein
MPERLLKVREARERLNLGVTKTYELISSGELPTIRVGRVIRVRESALDAWIERQQVATSVHGPKGAA